MSKDKWGKPKEKVIYKLRVVYGRLAITISPLLLQWPALSRQTSHPSKNTFFGVEGPRLGSLRSL